MELSWSIESVTELDYDDVSVTVKQYTPLLDGLKLKHIYIRSNSETDADGKTAIILDLEDKDYTWTSEI